MIQNASGILHYKLKKKFENGNFFKVAYSYEYVSEIVALI